MEFNRYFVASFIIAIYAIHYAVVIMTNLKNEYDNYSLPVLSITCGVALIIQLIIQIIMLCDANPYFNSYNNTKEEKLVKEQELIESIHINIFVNIFIFSSIYLFRFYELSPIYNPQLLFAHIEILYLIGYYTKQYIDSLPKQSSKFFSIPQEELNIGVEVPANTV